jgi:lipopolysaccharide/colanic/teichoic acid biosynthesis glycosyltransferase
MGRVPRAGARASLATLVLVAACSLVLAGGFRPVVQGDGVGYFSYLHGVLVHHGLDLTREYAAARAAGVDTDPRGLEAPTATGLAADYFPVGPALLAAPAYLAALLVGGAGQPDYSPLLAGAFTLTSLLLGLLALALCWRLTGSAVAVAGVALGTPLTYYLLFEPSYSHTFSAFAVSLFVLTWWRGRHGRSPAGWLWLGFLAGLMALVRWQDGALAAIALLTPPPGRARWRVLLMLPGALLALAPQLAVDHAIFGTWWPQRPPGQQLQPLGGHQLQTLLSSWHGLFAWHPLTLAATAGFLLVRDRTLRAACVYALVAETLINGSASDWWGSAAFGARRLVDLTPFWAIGLAALAARLPRPVARAGLVVAAVWNALLVANLDYVIRGSGDPSYRGLLAGQAAAVPYLPHLLARGVVARDLLARSPGPAAAWLAAEAACVLLAVSLAGAGRPGAYRRVREVLDPVLAAALAVPLLPLAALIAVAIRLDSPGPVLFRQVRGGQFARPFTMVKFRTMRTDAPPTSPKVDPRDPRVTRVGRLLRRSGLDELPQLWNVVRGDMSLIGPRPEQYALLEAYEPWQHERHLVKPGLTGWWQVHHRGLEPMRLNVERDIYYVRNQGPWLDAIIVARTLRILAGALLAHPERAPGGEPEPVQPADAALAPQPATSDQDPALGRRR